MKTQLQSILYQQEIISYQLILSRRKSLAIYVYPDKSIIVRAPLRTSLISVERDVTQRASWIKKQLDNIQQLPAPLTALQYIEGEQHLFLGNKYSLQISCGKLNAVNLYENIIYVVCKSAITSECVKRNLEKWYLKQGAIIFDRLMNECWQHCQHFHPIKPALRIRKMRSRWGSYSLASHTVTLNSELIKASQETILPVIWHELCHLQHFDHSQAFYRLLTQYSPKWREQKKILKNLISAH